LCHSLPPYFLNLRNSLMSIIFRQYQQWWECMNNDEISFWGMLFLRRTAAKYSWPENRSLAKKDLPKKFLVEERSLFVVFVALIAIGWFHNRALAIQVLPHSNRHSSRNKIILFIIVHKFVHWWRSVILNRSFPNNYFFPIGKT